MNEELFGELIESVREGGAILRGEQKPSRVFQYTSQNAPTVSGQIFAICVATDDPELLQTRKLYQVMPLANGLMSVIDDAGDTAIYSADYFILIVLPREVEEALSRVA